MATGEHGTEACGNPDCEMCRLRRPFTMPGEIIEALRNKQLVIFAGAGVSTEGKLVFKRTLYSEILRELGLSPDMNLSFPALMTRYCSQPNGRRKLLQKIKQRFDYMASFPELYRAATRFHRALSTIPQVTEIVTTNWDVLFEEVCGATPIVAPEDFTFWDVPGRKVFKIHGSIQNYGSIVATEQDYNKCDHNLRVGLIGSQLKLTLATKTVVFVGYSLSDPDFSRLYEWLRSELKELVPHAYVVTLNEDTAQILTSSSMTPIVTDATYFVEVLKQRLVEDGLMLADDRFSGLESALDIVYEAHEKLHEDFPTRSHPETIYAACYQDGLIHAFEYLLRNSRAGSCSDAGRLHNVIRSYKEIRRVKLSQQKYEDVAYIDGYVRGLDYLLATDEHRQRLPLYYLFGTGEIETFEEYSRLAPQAQQLHKTAFASALHRASSLSSEVEFHHIPFLD